MLKKLFQFILVLTLAANAVTAFPMAAYAASITNSPTLNGTSQYFSRTNAAQTGLGLTTNFTIECWVNFNVLPSVSGSSNGLVGKGDNLGGYRFFVNNANKLNISYRDVLGNRTIVQSSSALSLTTGTWTHLAATVNVGAASGSLIQDSSTLSTTNILSDSTSIANDVLAAFTLGNLDNDGSPTDYSNTRLSVCRVWSTNLSTATIIANQCILYGSPQTNMVGEWSLDNVLTDASGNANTLTNNGTITFGTNVPSCITPPVVASQIPLLFFLPVGGMF